MFPVNRGEIATGSGETERAVQNVRPYVSWYSSAMELLSLAIIIVLIGALLSIGWQLAPLILIGGIVYAAIRYRRQILDMVREMIRGRKGSRKK